jgi:hypothetical protein
VCTGCPEGEGGGRGGSPQQTQQQKQESKCPGKIVNMINKMILGGLPPVIAARTLAAITGTVVQVGVGGAAQKSILGTLGIGGEASISVAADPQGNVAITVTYGVGAGFGEGAIVGGQVVTSPRAKTVFDLTGGAGTFTVGGGVGMAAAVQLTTSAGGTFAVLVGKGTGSFAVGTTAGLSNTHVIPVICE